MSLAAGVGGEVLKGVYRHYSATNTSIGLVSIVNIGVKVTPLESSLVVGSIPVTIPLDSTSADHFVIFF